jgi:predicted enzyme related to lactoylglutathione lyase
MHAATALAAVNLACNDIDASVKFYRALGVDVREAKHAGTVTYSCALAGVHFALRKNDGTAAAGGAQLAFMIANLDGALAALHTAGVGRVVEKPTSRPWGMTAIAEDPDGRRVELVSTKVEMTGPMPF